MSTTQILLVAAAALVGGGALGWFLNTRLGTNVSDIEENAYWMKTSGPSLSS